MSRPTMRFGVATKIAAIAASFALPIAVLVFLMVFNINEFIRFAELEVLGNTYQRPVESLLQNLQEQQIQVHYCFFTKGDCSANIASMTDKINSSFRALLDVDVRIGEKLQFNDEGLGKRNRIHLKLSNLMKKWKKIEKQISEPILKDLTSIDEQYNSLVSDIRGVIAHGGDTSNLILDPDLDSYYLMDMTLLALPEIQDRIAKIAIKGYNALSRGTSGPGRMQLAIQSTLLKDIDLERVTNSSDLALIEDRNFYGISDSLQRELPPALKQHKAALLRFIELTRLTAESEAPGISADLYVQAAREAHTASFELWSTAARNLDTLIEKRIAFYQSRRVTSLLLASASLILASLLAFLIARGIRRSLSSMVESLIPGARLLSACAQRIARANKSRPSATADDDIIVEELSAHCDDMKRMADELAALVRGSSGNESAPIKS